MTRNVVKSSYYNDPTLNLGTALNSASRNPRLPPGFRWSPVRYVLRRYVTAHSVALIEICDKKVKPYPFPSSYLTSFFAELDARNYSGAGLSGRKVVADAS